ncbi:MAG: MarR family transcriptional regulator [Rhodospirillaceae bacterium]|nr:MarR family transcriptional regulator [Rhodospirillaceae bacterium]
MTDITTDARLPFLSEEGLRQAIELLYFVYRDFTAEPDSILARYDFGRAHHRVIYFVGRNPGTSVSELLAMLRITKQSLSRVLGHLVRDGFITQRTGQDDRRRRLLELTPAGIELEKRLTEKQRAWIARAFHEAGSDSVSGFLAVMMRLIGEADRRRFRDPALLRS